MTAVAIVLAAILASCAGPWLAFRPYRYIGRHQAGFKAPRPLQAVAVVCMAAVGAWTP